MSYIVHFLVPWTQNITIGLDPHNFKLITKKTDLSLNVILLPGCFLKTFTDIMFVTLLFYVFTCLSTCTCIVFVFYLFITHRPTFTPNFITSIC